VLPGLDTALAAEDRDIIRGGEDGEPAPQETHPQHAMLQTLRMIGLDASEVRRWPDGEGVADPPRQTLARALMRPAATSEKWAGEGAGSLPAAALAGIDRADAPSPREEAELVALALRRAVDEPETRAALVTPDRDLARRVAAALARWDIEVEDSAGTPLGGTPPGAFLRLTAGLGAGVAPLALLQVLQHPLALGGRAEGELRRQGRTLDLALRGLRAERDLGRLIAQLECLEPSPVAAIGVLRHVARLAGDFLALPAHAGFARRLAAHVEFAAALATDGSGDCRLWRGEDGEACAVLLDDLQAHAGALGGLDGAGLGAAAAYAGLLEGLLALEPHRRRHAGHPRIAVLGPLEARLQHVDFMVVGGLNEGVWPPEVEAGPWLSRPMRAELGLPQPEQRIGLAAHDFAGLLAAPAVLLTRAQRAEGAPTVPSRWLARLAVLTGHDAVEGRGADWRALLARDQASPPRAPKPKSAFAPPVERRPRELSVTAIEDWLKDPYGFCARHLLKLRKLDALDPEPEASDRGSLIHGILKDFLAAHPQTLPDDAVAKLVDRADAAFDAHGDVAAVRAFWRPQFARIAAWFVDEERARRAAGIAPLKLEHRGELEIAGIAGGFTVHARADRIDRRADGTLEIIDYKTGAVPTAELVKRGLRPQLALEGLIAREGGFEGVSGEVGALAYWRLAGGRSGCETRPAGGRDARAPDAATLIEAAEAGFRALVAAYYGEDARAYETGGGADPRYDDYGLLARRDETAEEG
jgi:ATP-dependent helicase/nuclease subunit B